MRPDWFKASIPLDPLIAPMVLFFQENGIRTISSCQGVHGHLYGLPTVSFQASTVRDIELVDRLLHENDLDTSLEIGLMIGYFARHRDGPYGQARWLWANGDNSYKTLVYDRVIKMVSMDKIKDIVMEHDEWVAAGYPRIG